MSAIVLRGDARDLPLPDESVDLIVTSPPYWSLRDYQDGGESLVGQIGAEATPQEYIDALVACTAEWMRVLKPEGSIFVVLGDKYANDAKWGGATSGKHVASLHGKTSIGRVKARTGFPPKSLLGLPWWYALECADQLGLTLRRDIIWSKVNGLPESVTDRCRSSHEYVFHFVKQPRYYSALDEIREQYAPETAGRYAAGYNSRKLDSRRPSVNTKLGGDTYGENPLGKLPGSVWDIASAPLFVPEHVEHGRCCGSRKRPGCQDGLDHHAAFPPELAKRIILGWSPAGICTGCGEGRRPVTDIQRVPLRPGDRPGIAGLNSDGAHGFDRRAGTHILNRSTITGSACACTPSTDHPERRGKDFHVKATSAQRGMNDGNGGERYRRYMEDLTNPRGPVREYHFTDWTPAPAVPAVVVDPFGGTGTSALVADVLGRTGITIDRSAGYCHLATWRTADPAERARVLGVPKPPPVMAGQDSLFDIGEAIA